MVHHLSTQTSVLNQFIAEIRDIDVQKDSLRFRRNLERIGEIFAYEISKTLAYEAVSTTTPLGVSDTQQLSQQPVIATILRAGLPFHNGILNYFDKAESAFISAYRKHHKDNSFDIALESISCPVLDGKTVILCDAMLASGASMVLTCKSLLAKGSPAHLHIATAIASTQGLDYLTKNMPTKNFTVWCGAIDEELTAQAYIVPGLGDAGDLAFGSKF